MRGDADVNCHSRGAAAAIRRPDDGLDGLALPRLPPAAGAACAAVHRDGACQCGDSMGDRGRLLAMDPVGASGGVAVGRQRSGAAGAGGADRRRGRLRRDQPQLRLSVRPRAGRPFRCLPDARAGAGGRGRGGDDRGLRIAGPARAGDGEVPPRRG